MEISHMKTRISVVIPTRDRAEVLPECLDRLLAEPEPPFEIIVVDSSSSTDTQEVLAYYPSVINVRLGNIAYSMVVSRNIGISCARGDIIAFLDDDSYVLSGWLREIAGAYLDPSVVAAGGRVIFHPWKKGRSGEPVAALDMRQDIIWGEWDRIVDHIVDVPHLMGCNCSVRREIALSVGGFDTNFVGSANLEETDFFFRVSKTGGRIVFVPTAVVEHRAAPRADGITRSLTNYTYRYSAVRNRLYFLRKHKARGLRRGVYRQVIDAMVGTGRLFVGVITFFAASMAGIIGGLLTKPTSKSMGLTVQVPSAIDMAIAAPPDDPRLRNIVPTGAGNSTRIG
jgi:glycosyltransferase involved in cell wall biosynthesis